LSADEPRRHTASDDDDTLCTPAWLLKGLFRHELGVLEYAGGRLAFTIGGRERFDVPLAEVRDVTFPWYYFGGGVKLTIRDQRYRFSFVEPGERGDIAAGRERSSAWKRVLAPGGAYLQ
jgi:hypothetical protein